MLPFFDNQPLFDQFNANEAWDSAVNQPLIEKMPGVFGNKTAISDVYWVNAFDHPVKTTDITDGTANTIMLLQNPNGGEWTRHDDLSIEDAVKMIRSQPAGQSLVVAYYDGRVDRIKGDVDETTLFGLLTPAGGEVLER